MSVVPFLFYATSTSLRLVYVPR